VEAEAMAAVVASAVGLGVAMAEDVVVRIAGVQICAAVLARRSAACVSVVLVDSGLDVAADAVGPVVAHTVEDILEAWADLVEPVVAFLRLLADCKWADLACTRSLVAVVEELARLACVLDAVEASDGCSAGGCERVSRDARCCAEAGEMALCVGRHR
jgi:hypothetical protein